MSCSVPQSTCSKLCSSDDKNAKIRPMFPSGSLPLRARRRPLRPLLVSPSSSLTVEEQACARGPFASKATRISEMVLVVQIIHMSFVQWQRGGAIWI